MSLSGILLVDKDAGPTSHDVVGKIRKAARIRRVGHAGTLDPFASGLLLLLLGSATRLAEYFLGMDKKYEATVHLGVETTTHDLDGEAVSEDGGWASVGEGDILEAMEGLKGRISQLPPVYSAKKVQGVPAHRRVRRGESVELAPVEVEVHSLDLLDIQGPAVRIEVECSSGTYVRALARDLGRALGVGAHLTALRRSEIGSFSVFSASKLEDLDDPESIQAALSPPAAALDHFPAFEVGPEDAARIRHGQFLSIHWDDIPGGSPIRVLLNGDLVAVAAREGDQLRPQKVFANG